MTTVLIADDQAPIRLAVTEILDAHPDVDVIGHATNGAEAVELSRKLHPDVVLMDIRMPQQDGITATADIRADESLASTRILILTTFEEDHNVVAALRAGADGFIGKGAEPDEIVAAVLTVRNGDTALSPNATRSLVQQVIQGDAGQDRKTDQAANQRSPHLASLTDREREVLVLVAHGSSNSQIADQLAISPHTAKTHVNRIMTKVSAHDRAQLVVVAYESGLINPHT